MHQMRTSRPSGELRTMQTGGPATSADHLAERAATLLRRMVEIEQALTAQEWWLLGRALPEARLLSEISSLLSVARGELEHFLADFFGRPLPATSEHPAVSPGDDDMRPDDPVWLGMQRQRALELLRVVAMSLPPMAQYAQMLHANAERMHFAVAALDGLGVIESRLSEAYELLQQPPA